MRNDNPDKGLVAAVFGTFLVGVGLYVAFWGTVLYIIYRVLSHQGWI